MEQIIPQYLADEIVGIQNKSMILLGIPRESLQRLQRRIDKQIQSHATHPCQKCIRSTILHAYNLRGNLALPHLASHTNIHQSSFISRAISILKKHEKE